MAIASERRTGGIVFGTAVPYGYQEVACPMLGQRTPAGYRAAAANDYQQGEVRANREKLAAIISAELDEERKKSTVTEATTKEMAKNLAGEETAGSGEEAG
jgi:hypothetical protein